MAKLVRLYVSVDATFDTEGGVVPTAIHWTNGVKFTIDKVLDVRPACSLKVGSAGMRYTCRIRGHRRFLFLEDIGRWFIECPENVIVRNTDDPC